MGKHFLLGGIVALGLSLGGLGFGGLAVANSPARAGQQPNLSQAVTTAVVQALPLFEIEALPLVMGQVVRLGDTPPPPQPAPAALRAGCTVRQILASAKEGGVDPRLAALKSQLSKPPFNGYKSFKLLAETELELNGGRPTALTLQSQVLLGLTYMEKLAVAQGRARMRMHLTMAGSDGKSLLDTIYAIDEGGTLLQAGQPFQDGTFVLAITCKIR